MLVEFKVRNFKSIKDEIILSAVVKRKDLGEFKDNVIENVKLGEDIYLSKELVIYGSNGSGKSNLLQSMELMKILMTSSYGFSKNRKMPYNGFKFCDNASTNTTLFELKFLYDDQLYIYGLEYNIDEIVYEYLRKTPKFKYNSKTSKVFERKNDKEFNKNKTISKLDLKFLDEIGKNRTYFSVAGFRNDSKLADIYSYIDGAFSFHVVSNESIDNSLETTMDKIVGLSDYKDYFKDYTNLLTYYLKNADVGIDHIEYNLKPSDIMSENSRDWIKRLEINTVHNIDGRKYSLPFDLESSGTKKLHNLIAEICYPLYKQNIFIFDEIDCSLHPEMLKIFIKSFNMTFKDKQLIFTCHDTSLLDANLLLKEQIWFTDKNLDDLSTDLYSLGDFNGIEKISNLRNSYLRGIFGAYPHIKFEEKINSNE